MEFIDRRRELKVLNNFVKSPQAGLLILYGRRRVGKTRLLTHFMETQKIKDGFYWMATTHNPVFQLRDFTQALFQYDPRFSTAPAEDFSFPDWETAFSHLSDAVGQYAGPQLVVLDEFTYLLRNDPALISLLQRLWDHRLSKQANLKLVLTGSLIGMMEREVISYHAPLYGRATALLRLRPLPFTAITELFPDRDVDERVAIFAVTGGVPAYLDLFTRASSFSRSLREHCFAPGSIMLGDPAVMLHEQLKEPQNFESVLSAIAAGFHTWGDIARMAGVNETSLGYYLQLLEELEFIERREPVLSPTGGRKGHYYFRDQFLHFYYRFIVPYLSQIDRGYMDVVATKINQQMRSFIGSYVFEGLCQEWVYAASALDELDFQVEVVGSYWRQYRGEGIQLDVVAANPRTKQLLIGESKWGKAVTSRKIITDLIQRSQRMPQVAAGWEVHYYLFSRQGYSDAAQEAAKEFNVKLVTLKDIETTLQRIA